MLKLLEGKKTYVVMIGGVLSAVGGIMTGTLDLGTGIALIINALGLGAIRSAVTK